MSFARCDERYENGEARYEMKKYIELVMTGVERIENTFPLLRWCVFDMTMCDAVDREMYARESEFI